MPAVTALVVSSGTLYAILAGSGGELLHPLIHGGRSLQGVGARKLIDSHHTGWRLVLAGRNSVSLISELDASDVAQVQNRPVGIGAKDDVYRILRVHEAPLRAHRVSELLPIWNRLATNLAGWVHIVLRLNCGDDFCCRNAEFRELIGLHPYAQRILPTEDLHARYAVDARDLVLKVDDGVVGEENPGLACRPAS